MSTICRFTVGVCCTLLLVAVGCSQPSNDEAAQSPDAPATTAAIQPADFQKAFKEAQRRAEEEQLKQKVLKERRRGFIEVAFHEFDAEGRVVVSVTNRTGKPIDDIRGGFQVEDAEGNYIASSGFTIAVPGDVFLEDGATLHHAPFMSERPELTERLKTAPDSVHFSFEAQEITYIDGTTQPDLDS